MKYTRKFLFCIQIAQIRCVFCQNKAFCAINVPFQPGEVLLPCPVKIVTKRKQFPSEQLQRVSLGAAAPISRGACRVRACYKGQDAFALLFCRCFRLFSVFRVISRYFCIYRALCRFFAGRRHRVGSKTRGNVFGAGGVFSISVHQDCFCERILSFSEKSRCVLGLRAMLYKKTGVEMAFLPIASPFQNRYNIRKRNIFSFL